MLAVIDELYDGALDERRWRRALAGIGTVLAARGVVVARIEPRTGRFAVLDIADTGGSTGPIANSEHVSLTPSARTLAMDIGPDAVIALWRDPVDPPFNRRDRAWLEQVVPHLARVIEIRRRLQNAEARRNLLAVAAEQLPFGLIVLGNDRRILEVSAKARRILAKSLGIRDRAGRLVLARRVDETALTRLLQASGDGASLGSVLTVERGAARAPLILDVRRLAGAAPAGDGEAALWIVLVSDPEDTPVPTVATIPDAFGLTDAEAALAGQLVNGRTLADAAKQLGIRLSTARSRLKSVFAKVGVARQAALIQRVLQTAGGFAPHAVVTGGMDQAMPIRREADSRESPVE